MANIDQAEATNLLKALCNGTAYTVPPAWYVALTKSTFTPTATSMGATANEVATGARQAVTFTTASAGATSNSATVSFSSMPADITGSIEIHTTSTVGSTTRRLLYGALTANKTTASGDILSFNSGAITMSLGQVVALALRAASGANQGATTATSQAITLPTGTTTNDLVYFVVSVQVVVSSPTLAGWTLTLTTNATNTQSTIVGYRTIQAGDTNPTVSWTSGGKAAYTAIALSAAAGQQATHSGFATPLNSGTAGVSFTPNTFAAGAVTGTSVLLTGAKSAQNAATAVTTTAPSSWTEPTNGDQSTAVGTTAALRQAAASVSYNLTATGTVAPGAVVLGGATSSTAIVHHAFAIETALPPPVGEAFIYTAAAVGRSRNY